MTIYDISIDYQTGDSFGNEEVYDEHVGIVTTDLEKAKENLRRIKEHYEKYKDEYKHTQGKFSLKLLTDDDEREIFPFWIGYFETLRCAKIVTESEEDSDMVYHP